MANPYRFDSTAAYQQGVNLAEQRLRMSDRRQQMRQSRELHPWRVKDAQSVIEGRDASTNLAKQSFRFNERTEDDRASLVKSSARQQVTKATLGERTLESDIKANKALASKLETEAGIAEKTKQATINMRNIAAWNAARDRDVREGVDVNLETNAQSAQLNRIITDQTINERTQQSQIDRYEHETKLADINHQIQQLRLDLTRATQPAQQMAIEAELRAAKVKADEFVRAADRDKKGRPVLQASMSEMARFAGEGNWDAIDSMVIPKGLTASQKAEWAKAKSHYKNNKNGQLYDVGQAAGKEHAGNVYVKAQRHQPWLQELGLMNEMGEIPKNKIHAVGRLIDNRERQQKMLEGLPIEAQDKLLMEASRTTDPLSLFGEGEDAGTGVGQAQGEGSLAGKNASMYGKKYGDEFVLNERGLERLAPLVSKLRGEAEFADNLRKTQAQVSHIQAWGLSVSKAAIDNGKITLDFDSKKMSSAERATQTNALYKTLQDAALEAAGGESLSAAQRLQLMSEARRHVYAADLQSATTAAELRGMPPATPVWNPLARNADGSVGGVRTPVTLNQSGLDFHGQPAGGGSPTGQGQSGDPLGKSPPKGVTPKPVSPNGADYSNDPLYGQGGFFDGNEIEKIRERGDSDMFDARQEVFDTLRKYTIPTHARKVLVRVIDAEGGRGFGFFTKDPSPDNMKKLVRLVMTESVRDAREAKHEMLGALLDSNLLSAQGGVNKLEIDDKQLHRLIDKPANEWPSEITVKSLKTGRALAVKLNPARINALKNSFPNYLSRKKYAEDNKLLDDNVFNNRVIRTDSKTGKQSMPMPPEMRKK
jgi:hypothetical protein